MKKYVRESALPLYGLSKNNTGSEVEKRINELDTNFTFLFPDGNVSSPLITTYWQKRERRFFHPAIIATTAGIFFGSGRKGLGDTTSSKGQNMRDQIPRAAIAWICTVVLARVSSANSNRFVGV
jgi:Domain of unknown function (DUF6532)